ncbi:hypothetical protein [Novipirellula galeiformis]|nr:hypothetical protein [Novipirellula galeiformis]
MLSCVDAATGGHVYLTDRGGTIVVFEDSATFKVVATNVMDETHLCCLAK